MGFLALFRSRRPLIGVVHLLPLPGAPNFDGDLAAITDRARRDAIAYEAAGFDGLIVENFGDAPFYPGSVPPETVAAMAVVTARLAADVRVPIGVNVLRNDAASALAVAAVAGGRFIRVNVHAGAVATDQGLIEGLAHETLRERARLGANVRILADVLVKPGRTLGPDDPAQAARETAGRGLADALLVTGPATGAPPDLARLSAIREAVREVPVLIASGITAANAAALAPHSDGGIVGTSVKRGGRTEAPVDARLARRLVAAWREAGA